MLSSTLEFVKKILADKFEEWRSARGMVYARAIDAPFDELYISMKPIGFFEYKYNFSAIMTLVPTHMMNDRYAEIYRRLKGLECDLKIKGLLRKNFFFITRRDLDALSQLVEDLKPNDLLASELTNDSSLMGKIRKLGAIELTVRLKSITELYAPFVASREAMLQAEKAFYENPEDIVWILTLSTILTQGPRLRRNVQLIYEVLYDISQKIKDISNRLSSD
ncbi:MAG: hypothetical protein DRJ51_00015 [Thermoprotei archaeon]|nr:MAG: hypothetical protein DRJ36_00600 [Thermoprotei archaeon]RLE82875.1 MAG: hypothetical protein DRJ51_00015 [Thermoprotei archaeon]RLF03509.1 MAG: hypothetical protein DRJ59_00345 [Thermoprotei archaeon]